MHIIHPSTGQKAQDISSALALLDAAKADYDQAFAKANGARREETAALNRLNDAQKAFDAAVADLRAQGPIHSQWAEQLREQDRERVAK